MDFSSLVLMEKDKETNVFVREIDSFTVNEGAEYISKFYCEEGKVYIFFDTKNDVEDWEYTAIFDNFNEELFTEKGYDLEEINDEYNPTWRITFNYDEEYEVVHSKLNEICDILQKEFERVFTVIKERENEYK